MQRLLGPLQIMDFFLIQNNLIRMRKVMEQIKTVCFLELKSFRLNKDWNSGTQLLAEFSTALLRLIP
jgi:hypothetical protein